MPIPNYMVKNTPHTTPSVPTLLFFLVGLLFFLPHSTNAQVKTSPNLSLVNKPVASTKRVYELKDTLEFIHTVRKEIPKGNDFAEYTPLSFSFSTLEDIELSNELKNYLLQRPVIRFSGCERFTYFAYYNYSTLTLERNGALKIAKVEEGKLDNIQRKLTQRKSNKAFAASSVLKPGSGKWYKIGVTKSGVYKIDYSFLKSMGLNPDTINPQHINLYGNSAGVLPEAPGNTIPDDLLKNAIYISGEGDGQFNTNDYIVFYGHTPIDWSYNSSFKRYLHQPNNYSDTSYYFINISSGNTPKRVASIANTNTPNTTVNSFDDYVLYEANVKNFIKSGRNWVGEEFDIITNRDYEFSLGDVKTDAPVKFYGFFAGNTSGSSNSSTFNLSIPEGGISRNIVIAGIVPGQYADAARLVRDTFSFYTSSPTLNLNLNFSKFSVDSKGWLDYMIFNFRKNLSYSSSPMTFRDRACVGAGKISQFNLTSGDPNLKIWNITSMSDAFDVMPMHTGITWTFTQNTDSLLEFVVFNENHLTKPIFEAEVDHQDLHALGAVDYLIITHPEFIEQANELSVLHASRGISNHVVTTDQIYNEFSSGMRDIAAIRDFIYMFYSRAAGDPALAPKYVLLFGDGSYDNKSVLGMGQNFIPTFQSTASVEIIGSYTSDDYFGLLDDNELVASSSSLLDIGVGRLIAKTKQEAKDMVNKIKSYVVNTYVEQSESCCNTNGTGNMAPWRNKIILIADDEDGSQYVGHCEDFSDIIDAEARELEVQKIYLDATTQTSTPGGHRYYEAESLLKNGVQNGALIVNYVGHGGEVGWAHERLLDIPTINGWTNNPQLPIFVTATCEFSRFDDPFRTSAGEFVLLNSKGGAVSMLTTSRLVISNDNYNLVLAFYNNVFDLVSNEPKYFGEVIKLTKNMVPGSNTRNFCLLGDPAIQLKLPFHRLQIDSINGIHVSSFTDTLKALSTVNMKGHIEDQAGNVLNSFNGIAFPKVYDKISNLATLGQDPSSSVIPFKEWKNLIFKGKSTITNGYFSFNFVVPKDLNQTVGTGRFVGYGNDITMDAHGYNEGFNVGDINTNAPADNNGPEISAYLNDEKFVNGGTTNSNPYLIINLKDENGINTVGTGIGHDITCVLDGETAKTIILNDNYQAEKDSYQEGKVKYQFENLTPGEHTLKVKAFDVYNNSSEKEIKFVVEDQTELVLNHVLNYPNPFTTKTEFMFEHNFSCNYMNVQVQIFTVSGKLVRTIDEDISTEGFRVNSIFWDGKDDYGDKLGRGTYIYRLKAKANQQVAEKIERLVILY